MLAPLCAIQLKRLKIAELANKNVHWSLILIVALARTIAELVQ